MNYMLRDRAVIDQFVLSSKGVGSIQRQIYVPQMKRTVLAIPPRLEQDQIARFLSWKTSEMMHFIKEKMIEIIRLRELKKALIDRTVLRGIENDVQIKNTGIEWIQHIPVHWKLRKVRELFIERREKVSDKEYIPLSVCKAGIVPRLESAVQTDNGDNRKLVITGDFVINSRSDRKGSSGISPLNGSVSLINIVLKPITNENPQYLHYLLRSTSFTEEFYRNGRGLVSDLWTTRYSELKNIFLPMPPQSEQVQIVAYLRKKSEEIDNLVVGIQKEISFVQELKIRTISDVVNGKIDVRDVIIPSFKDETEALVDNEDIVEEFYEDSNEVIDVEEYEEAIE